MSDWASIQTAIPAAVRQVLGDTFDCGWLRRDARWRSAAHCTLRVVSRRITGRTENRLLDNGDKTFTERAYTPAVTTVQFTFEAQDQDLLESAIPLAEQVATALRRSDVYDILCAAGLGIATVGQLNVVDYVDDSGRWRTAVAFDVEFNTFSSVVVRAGILGNYMDNVVVNDIEIPEIVLPETIFTEAGLPILTEDGFPLETEG